MFQINLLEFPTTKCIFVLYVAYLASLEDADIVELALREYKTATNMTEQFAALAAIVQKPGKIRDEVLDDFYGKWQHDYLVIFQFNSRLLTE